MVVEKGYKQTEIGVIPEDWKAISFTEAAELKHGFQFREEHFSKQGIKVIKIGNLSYNGSLNFDTISFVPESKLKDFSNFLLNIDDVLMALTGATLGKCTIVEKQELLFQNYRVGNFKNKSCSIKKFVFYILQSDYIQKTIKKLVNEAAQPNLGKGDFDKFIIPLPPLPEQTAIANALSDMDALIAQTEKLIEKKKAIKQGVMQELLKPKEGWVTKKLGEVANFRRGSFPQPYGLDKWYDDITGKPFVQVFDVDDNKKLKSETKRYISEEAQKMSVFAKKGTIVLTIQGSIGRIAITQYDAFIDRTLLIFESYKYEFNEYFFMHTIHQLFEIEKQSAPGGIIKTITKDALKNFSISFPEFAEQTRIGLIIKDLESDIVTIETKLQKLKHQKQGMMQALLTGKIRLI